MSKSNKREWTVVQDLVRKVAEVARRWRYCEPTGGHQGQTLRNQANLAHSLDARVILDVVKIPGIPLLTAIIDAIQRSNGSQDFLLTLHNLKSQTRACMPSNMAMQKPNTRVVRLECHDKVPVGRKQGHITTRRIVVVEGSRCRSRIVGGRALSQDSEVMAVKMDRMSSRNGRLQGVLVRVGQIGGDDHVNETAVLVVVINHGILRIPRGVLKIDDGWIGEIQTHGYIQQLPVKKLANVQTGQVGIVVQALGVQRVGINLPLKDGLQTGVRLIAASKVRINRSAGRIGGVARIVSDDASLHLQSTSVFEVAAGGGCIGTDPEIRSLTGIAKGFNNDAVALADTNHDVIGLIGMDGNKVRGNDLELVLVDREGKEGVHRTIDQAKKIAFAPLEDGFEWFPATHTSGIARIARVLTSAIEQDALRLRKMGLTRQFLMHQGESRRMNPVGENDGSQSFIPIFTGRTVDEKGTSSSISILQAVMGVVPRMTVLLGGEVVGIGIPLSNGALSNTVDTIHFVGTKLTKTMPVNSRTVIREVIGDMDDDLVTPAGFNQRTRVRAIEDLALGLDVAIGSELVAKLTQSKPIL
jgi:hypothetical protein